MFLGQLFCGGITNAFADSEEIGNNESNVNEEESIVFSYLDIFEEYYEMAEELDDSFTVKYSFEGNLLPDIMKMI